MGSSSKKIILWDEFNDIPVLSCVPPQNLVLIFSNYEAIFGFALDGSRLFCLKNETLRQSFCIDWANMILCQEVRDGTTTLLSCIVEVKKGAWNLTYKSQEQKLKNVTVCKRIYVVNSLDDKFGMFYYASNGSSLQWCKKNKTILWKRVQRPCPNPFLSSKPRNYSPVSEFLGEFFRNLHFRRWGKERKESTLEVLSSLEDGSRFFWDVSVEKICGDEIWL